MHIFPKQKLNYERRSFRNRVNDDNQIKNNKNNFSRTLEQFFLTVGQNNFESKMSNFGLMEKYGAVSYLLSCTYLSFTKKSKLKLIVTIKN